MRKKMCCIFMLIIFLLNSSIMIVISEAIDAIQKIAEEKVKAIAEIKLTKYENFDTTTEDSSTGSKGVLVQFNLKTGIEFAEGEKNKPIQKTSTNISLPWVGDYKPSRVEVITKSTQATNGGKQADYEYHKSTGILSITAENSENKLNDTNARDEYEIICIYRSDCYTNNKENNLKVQLKTYEYIKENEDITTVQTEVEENYTCTENIDGVISIEHETEDVYNGYITANTLNSENKYETKYNEKLKIMVSNKEIAQKIEVKENSETSLYIETIIDKKQILDILGENGSIDILDEKGNILKTINKDTEAEEDKIKITYENRTQNIIIQLKDLEKEGIIEIENSRVIEPTAQITDNVIPTQVYIKGINSITKEIKNDEGKDIEETLDLVKYERNGQIETKIKQAVSNIDIKIDKDTLVNNTQNEGIITAILRTDGPQYSLFKNPIINIELPAEVENINIGTPEILYDNQIFTIIGTDITTNSNGNKVIVIKLQGSQTSYEDSTVVKGTNIRIPVTISLTKKLQSKVGIIKCIYSNEMTGTTESRETEVTLLNKIVETTQNLQGVNVEDDDDDDNDVEDDGDDNEDEDNGDEENNGEENNNQENNNTENNNTENNNTGNNNTGKILITKDISAGNGKNIYERQVQKITLKITNNTNNEIANVNLQDEIPNEFIYTKTVCDMGLENGYIEDEKVTKYEEKIEKLQAKETLTFEYYVRVKQGQEIQDKKVSSKASATIEGSTETFESNIIENTIKESKFQIDMVTSNNATSIYRKGSPINYKIVVKNITNEKLTGVTITNVIPEGTTFEEAFYLFFDEGEKSYLRLYEDQYINDNYDKSKKMVTWNIGELDAGKEVGVFVSIVLGEIQGEEDIKIITNTASVKADNTQEYVSNKEEIKEMNKGNYKVELETNLEDKYLYEKDKFEYIVKITNIGNISIDNAIVADELPKGVRGISATYGKEGEEQNSLSISENVELLFSIEPGEVFVARFLVVAEELDEGVEQLEIKNQVEVSSGFIDEKASNEVVNIILKKKAEQEENKDPEDPTTPTDPSNPTTPTVPTDTKILISGIAWIDENENGKRDTDEQTYSNMTVMLYDYKNNTFVKENGQNKKVETNEKGEYEFTNIDKGQYIVVFLYDTNTYKLTEYQKQDIINSKNNDAITKTIEIDGNTVTAGLTNTLIAEQSFTNIDIGLIENRNFDFEIQKYIEKITVQTKDGKTKTYTYDNKQFAKVEIHSKKINGATVVIEYKMIVTNNGEVPGTVAQIVDKLPSGLKFNSELNDEWYESNGNLYTNSLADQIIDAGESEEIDLVLTRQVNSSNVGTITNTALIGISSNEKAIEDGNTQNDYSSAQIIIGISTGTTVAYVTLTICMLGVMVLGIYLIKKEFLGKEEKDE